MLNRAFPAALALILGACSDDGPTARGVHLWRRARRNHLVLGCGSAGAPQVESTVPFASLVGSLADEACGMTRGGHPYCWTVYDDYYLFDDQAGLNSPQPVSGALTFSEFRLGDSRACGIERRNPAWVVCWGTLPSATRTRRPVYVLRAGRP